MTIGALAPLAIGVLVWFGLAFGTKTWTRQWIAAAVAGVVMAWWRFGAMQDMAGQLGVAPMHFIRFAGLSVAGMLVVASVGMALHRLLQMSRRAG